MRTIRSLLLFLLTLVASSLAASSAFAHATLVSTHPVNGSVLEAAPERIQLQFNEAVSVTSVRLVDAAGHLRARLKAEARGPIILITTPTDLPQGTQVLSYRIVSEDGHPVGGVLTFSVGAEGRAADLGSYGAGRPQAIWVLRALIYLCLLGGVGAVFFQAWLAPPGASFRIMPVLATGFVALVLSVGLQGLDLLDEPWLDLLGLEPWEAAILTSYGAMAGLAGLALILAAAAMAEVRIGRQRALTALALLFAGGALAATGHASTASPQALMRPVVALHVMAASLWAGSLVPLFLLAGGACGPAGPILRRFSSLATPSVSLLIVAGCILAIVQVETPQALLETPYGRLLLVKLGLVGVLLLLAAVNRFRLTPAVEAQVPGAVRRLRWSIGAEIALMVLLAGVVAGWRFTPPPRNLAAELPPMIHLHGEKLMVMVSLSPGRVGSNKARLEVLDGSYAPFDPLELQLTLAPADGSLEPREIKARRDSEGVWTIDDVFVPMPGAWTVKIGALVNDFERVDLSAEQLFNR